ncbi:actin filament-associated protein 1-like [Glandiceps talaboti]
MSVIHYGVLYQKRLMGTQWSKRFCMIRNMRFIAYAFKLTKEDMKIVIDVSLVGFEVSYSQKEGLKRSHVLKISHSGGGGDKFLFAVAKKDEAQKWLNILTECAKATISAPTTPQTVTAPSTLDITGENPTPEADRKVIIIERKDSATGEENTKKIDSLENLPSPTKGDQSPKMAKKNLADSLAQTASSLLAFKAKHFAKKKGKKKSPTSPVADIPRRIESDTIMSGYLNVCSTKLSDGKWNKCWCIVKDNAFKCYKINSDQCQVQVPLQGCDLQPVQDSKNRVMANMFQLIHGKDALVYAECVSLDEMARWIRTLIHEIGSVDEDFIGEYVEPEAASGELRARVIKSADGEVVTRKDIVAKTMKLFEKQLGDNLYMDVTMDFDDDDYDAVKFKSGKNVAKFILQANVRLGMTMKNSCPA